MSERETTADLIREWQSGAFLVLVCALSGLAAAWLLRPFGLVYALGIGFVGGGLLAFVVLSYVLYGR